MPTLEELIGRMATAHYAHLSQSGDIWQCLSPFGELTRDALVSQLHEPVLIRNIHFCRALALRIIDAQGGIDRARLQECIQGLSRYRYCVDPCSLYESRARGHALALLQRLATEQALGKALLAIRAPSDNPHAQDLVRHTLALPERSALTDAHARQACLCVLLSYFRQNVGSCFATAPGIIVQTNHPRQLLQDLHALLDTAKLERYFDGAGLEVPLSRSAGIADYKKPIAPCPDPPASMRRFSHSPALGAALQAAGLLTHLSAEQRRQTLTDWLTPAARDYAARHGDRPLSVEQLLKWIGMRAFDIDEADLQRHALSPAPIIQDGMLMHLSFVRNEKHDACAAFLHAFGQMETAFKRYGENPLLKAWEYTLASLTDHTSGFTRSNLYHSLGIDPGQPYGIGHIVQLSIQELLDEYNNLIARHAREHEQLAMRAYSLQHRLNTSDSRSWPYLRMDYNQVIRELREAERSARQAHHTAHYLASLFHRLLNRYLGWFAEFFQEIYDPDLHGDSEGNHADAPAGFRLYFKPTRSQSSQWQAIHDEKTFAQALQEFFRVTEISLLAEEDKSVHDALRDVVTRIVRHIMDPEFMRQAQQRLAASKGGPSRLGRDCTPWAYISGGSVETLLQAYLRTGRDAQEWSRHIEDPAELFEFTVSCLRQIHAHEKQPSKQAGRLHDVVMCSPTHAFSLKPFCAPFQQCWRAAADARSWLDAHVLLPARQFYRGISLDAAMQQHLLAQLTEQALSLPGMRWPAAASPAQFRRRVLEAFPPGRPQRHVAELLDGLLYRSLPLISGDQALRHCGRLLKQAKLHGPRLPAVLGDLFAALPPRPYWGAEALQKLALGALFAERQCLFAEEDWQQRIADAARHLRLAAPQPILFADSNWFGWEFAFVYNPGSDELDIWQCDYLGRQAQPVSLEKRGEWQIIAHDFSRHAQ